VANALKGQIIQLRYGNAKYHKVEDIVYKDLKEVFVDKSDLI
jgi:hypothetical protein